MRGAFCALLLLWGCEAKEVDRPPPTYADEVSELLAAACAECHSGDAPAADYDVTTFLSAVGCLADGRVAIAPPDETAPIVAVLSRDDHATVVTAEERELLLSWVESGATDRWAAAHPPGFTDPRSESFHGAVLRAASWEPLYDTERPDACGRCHEGAPARPEGVGVAPGAPSCTDCHDRPAGALDCGTCHGDGAAAHPPRDTCYFGDQAGEGLAHAAHAARGIACAECHGERDDRVGRGGLHGNGLVEIALSELAGGDEASYDEATGECAVYCHARGGERTAPRWSDEGPLDCQSCHLSPPPAHYPGACDRCHAEANADGTALVAGPLHLDGVVEFGDGTGGCGACHGEAGEPWPPVGAHLGHHRPSVTREVDCASCHPVPAALDDPGHLDGAVQVELSGLAAARDVVPVWDPSTRSCVVACHGEGIDGAAVPRPIWERPLAVRGRCDACHGLPPPATHPIAGSCSSTICHGDEVAPDGVGFRITESGLDLHLDGDVDLGGSP